MLQIKVSDLFQGPYNHDRRMAEQQEFINRLMQLQNEAVHEDIKTLVEFQQANICSIITIEMVVESLRNKHITLV